MSWYDVLKCDMVLENGARPLNAENPRSSSGLSSDELLKVANCIVGLAFNKQLATCSRAIGISPRQLVSQRVRTLRM